MTTPVIIPGAPLGLLAAPALGPAKGGFPERSSSAEVRAGIFGGGQGGDRPRLGHSRQLRGNDGREMLSQRPVLSASSPSASRAPSSLSVSRGRRRHGLRYRGPTIAPCLREFPTQTQAKQQYSPFANLGKPPGRKRHRRPGALGWAPEKFSSKPLVGQLKRG